MKLAGYILLLLMASPVVAQEWRDTLADARQSYLRKDYERAYRQYRSAAKLTPKEIDLSDEVAQSAYKAGKYQEAEKIYAASSSNKGSAVQKGMVSRQIGNARMKQEKYAEAIESYKESLRNNPSDEYARYNLAEAMRRQRAQQEKEKQQKKDQQDPGQPKDQQGKQDQQPQGNKPDDGSNGQKRQPRGQKENDLQRRSGKANNQLSDKRTERMLDELMKQEMETKRRFEGMRSTVNIKKTGKDW